ncbi:MAG: hypothetical protein E4G90_11640 [Gemmatimonadales bacterium]|nr:MAG: hypothetical protein E4G90_11640 [Gemmatimonadales bacterium]
MFGTDTDVTILLTPLHGIWEELQELNRLTRVSLGLEDYETPDPNATYEGVGFSNATDESTYQQEQDDAHRDRNR